MDSQFKPWQLFQNINVFTKKVLIQKGKPRNYVTDYLNFFSFFLQRMDGRNEAKDVWRFLWKYLSGIFKNAVGVSTYFFINEKLYNSK